MNLRHVTKRFLLVLGLPCVLVAVWWLATWNSTSPYVPPLQDVFRAFPRTWTLERLQDDALPSLTRLVVGYFVAVTFGVLIGVPVGLSRTVRSYVEPVLEFFRAVPPPVLVPILILAAGIGDAMKVLVIISGCIWPVLLNTVEGVRSIDDVLSETSRCYRIRRFSRIRYLVIRSASPQIVAGMRQALSIAIILMVISEMFAASSGLGYTLVQFQRTFAIPEMWTGILVLGLIGVGLSIVFRIFERHALRWYLGLRRSQLGGE